MLEAHNRLCDMLGPSSCTMKVQRESPQTEGQLCAGAAWTAGSRDHPRAPCSKAATRGLHMSTQQEGCSCNDPMWSRPRWGRQQCPAGGSHPDPHFLAGVRGHFFRAASSPHASTLHRDHMHGPPSTQITFHAAQVMEAESYGLGSQLSPITSLLASINHPLKPSLLHLATGVMKCLHQTAVGANGKGEGRCLARCTHA